jgi:hypothetical protein
MAIFFKSSGHSDNSAQYRLQDTLHPIKPEINTFKIDFPFPFKNGSFFSILTFFLHLEIKTWTELWTIGFDRLKSYKEFRAGMSETHQNPKVCLVSKIFCSCFTPVIYHLLIINTMLPAR